MYFSSSNIIDFLEFLLQKGNDIQAKLIVGAKQK